MEGYLAGYENGSSDATAYEWGSGSKHRNYLDRERNQAWEDSDTRAAATATLANHDKTE